VNHLTQSSIMTVGGRVGALWIGGLEPYMDEGFLQVSEKI
jgi:hypothetical protein